MDCAACHMEMEDKKKPAPADLVKAAPGGDGEGKPKGPKKEGPKKEGPMPCADECKDAEKDTCEDIMESCIDCEGEDCDQMCGACMDCADCFMDMMADDDKLCAAECKDA